MRKGKRLSILIITLGMLLAGCGKSEQADASIPELLEPISVAENTIQVKRQDFYFADYIDVTVVPQMEELYFVMDGEILEIEVKEGQLVKKGDVLAKIDQTQLNDAIKELQETISYEDKIYNMQLTQADLEVQIAEAKLSKLQAEYDEQEQKKAEEAKKKAEEEAKKKAEAEAATQAAAKSISIVQNFDVLLTEDASLQIAEEGAGSDQEGSAPSDSSTPSESSTPEEGSTPSDSSAPGESSTPDESSVPQESSTPEESSKIDDDSAESSSIPGAADQPGGEEDSSDSSGNAGGNEESSENGQPDDSQQPESPKDPEEEQRPQIEITKHDLQQARLAVQEAQLGYNQLQDDYEHEMSQRQSEMQSLLDKVGEDTIYASFSGRVVKINANVGDYVRQYDTVMMLVNEEVKTLRGKKYSNTYLMHAANIDVVIDGTTYGAEYVPYGEDEYLKRSLNRESLPSRFTMEETDEVTFGESGTVRVYKEYSIDTLVIPASCLQSDDLGEYVYKSEDGQRIKTYVTVGIRTATYAEILDGLNEGDDVYGTE